MSYDRNANASKTFVKVNGQKDDNLKKCGNWHRE